MATGNSGRGRSGQRGRDPQNPDAVASFVADRVNEAVDGVADKVTRKVERKVEEERLRVVRKVEERRRKVADQVERHAEKLERIAPVAQAAYGLWTRERPGTRQPRHSLDDIAVAAMRVADTEGVDALSMRRLAAELGAGTMTLYHYVHTKGELLVLLGDRVMAELVLPDDELPTEWRAAMTAIARRTRHVLLAHPWVFDIAEDPTIGPNGVRHFDQSLRALASLDLTFTERLDILQAVDEYVFGHCLHARREVTATDSAGPAGTDAMLDYVVDLSRSGDYPQVAALIEEHGARGMWDLVRAHENDPDRFDRNLARVLDGIERDVPPSSGTRK